MLVPPGRSAALLSLLAVLAPLAACGKDRLDASPSAETAAVPRDEDVLSASVAGMGGSLASRLAGRTVAVFEFPDLKGDVSELGALVSEQLTTEIVRAGGDDTRVVERRQVVQVLEELNLRKADLTTSEVEIAARQLGADAVVVGSASVVGRRIEVNARAVDVSGGSLLTAERFSIRGDDDLLRLAGRRTPLGATGGEPTAAGGPPPPSAPVTEASIGPVGARISECRATGSEVVCSLVMLSATVDAQVEISRWNPSEARDDGGNAYLFSSFTFGSEHGAEWRTLLVSREPTPARLTITGVPNTMTRLTRISAVALIRIGERQIDGQSFVFRNVPIVREND